MQKYNSSLQTSTLATGGAIVAVVIAVNLLLCVKCKSPCKKEVKLESTANLTSIEVTSVDT